ncbi:A-type potassium channel modulatory protein KCNIP1 isoform X2 [Homo sapiens]|uniref:A-type potassium channel modulatory protein KCNIP1 isoform X2 n=1 Tax=Homo sapiens TaxID=9606 RepID=UPI0007DC54CA|nr:Kv channel-interacting protein 1 isoform X2 [Homo sapiens]XP_054208453.1 Kv channel-interacting protein 1 isoform X2 [Homo sapiens]|eukprot:XP_016864897.1 Kv channel-interacting protein 1 isoform X2 [Homo sapiens]
MSGCSKRCKLGFVKFAQTIFKLITGTLSKGYILGRPPRGPSFKDRLSIIKTGGTEHLNHQTLGQTSPHAFSHFIVLRSPEGQGFQCHLCHVFQLIYLQASTPHFPSSSRRHHPTGRNFKQGVLPCTPVQGLGTWTHM